MSKEKSLVEDAILQMKNLEEAVAENAKGILASTMKEEISELVKESLNEADEDEEEIETDVEMGTDTDDESDTDETDMEDSDEDEAEVDITMDTDTQMPMDMDEPIDLTDESDEEVLRVFELMGPEDKIVVKKDAAGNINLKDTESNKEYMIVGESEEEREMYNGMEKETNEEMENFTEEDDLSSKEFSDNEIQKIVDDVFMGGEKTESEDKENVVYEIEMDDEDYEDYEDDEEDYEEDEEEDYEEEFGESYGEKDEEVVYEIEIGEDSEMEDFDMLDMDTETDEYDSEFVGNLEESKMKMKYKGVGMGKPKFSYDKNPNEEGFSTVKKKADKTMGTGNAKKVNIYKDKTNMDGKMKVVKGSKKMETKEASRTLGVGRSHGRKGLPKPKTYSRHVRLESTDAELQILRDKNEEYRKALNVFRNKLNEVAVFNSNLAYATRLFTEHSTSKQEKINILRRFDTVESLKESKNLYKVIKDELGTKKTESINESVERVVTKTPSNGSSTNLIESKTYENPQFLRMKDLMSKIK